MVDDGELAAIFRAEFSRLVRSLTAAAGSAETAADAVQEAFVQAHVHWWRVRHYDDPTGWIRRVAVNRVLNQRRGHRRRADALARLAALRPSAQDLPAPSPAVLDALAALPLRQRTAVALRYLGQLPVSDVARAMSISEGAVKAHLHRARGRLLETLEVSGDH